MILILMTVVLATVISIVINRVQLNKPSRSTFILIKLINVLYYIQSWFYGIVPTQRRRIEVSQLIVYPIKSCKGVSLDTCIIDENGFQYDRMYMFGIWDKNRFKSITQREFPKLCLCEIDIIKGEKFQIKWPGSQTGFYLPAVMTDEFLHEHYNGSESPVHLWEVEFKTHVLEGLIPDEFRQYVGLPIDTKLLYSERGKSVKTNVPKPLRSLRTTKFQEHFPLLLMSEEDITDFKSRFSDDNFPISEVNFRPNIMVKGIKNPYEIDLWNKITIGQHKWLIISKCPRCSIPNINYQTGEMDSTSRVSKELMKYRRCDPGNPYLMFLGVHGIQLDTGYLMHVGDPIEIQQKLINYYKPLE